MDGNEDLEADLPLIDPKKDDWNLWALLDEGCNSTCHGEQWRIHAQAVLKRRGYAPMRLSESKSSFSGIGDLLRKMEVSNWFDNGAFHSTRTRDARFSRTSRQGNTNVT